MAETMNMMEISVDRFIKEIKLDLEDENYDPVIGIGKSGVGKTMSIAEMCEELGIGFCELRLVTLTEIDLLGIPTIENGRTTYASNALLPDVKRDGEKGILVLDEITSCSSTLRAAAYQLLDSKRALGNYKLPEHWKVVALGNGISDGGVFSGMEHAFLSRATCYRIEPNLNSWMKWAVNKGVNPSITAFLKFDPTKLHEFDPDEIASVFPCPRSWTALSKKLNAREKRNGGMLPLEQVELYAAGTVGITVAASFSAFYQYNTKSTVSAEDVLSGKAEPSAIKEMGTETIYLLLSSIVKNISEELKAGNTDYAEFTPECMKRTANLCKWVIGVSAYKLDYSLMCFSDLAQIQLFSDMVIVNDQFDEICPEFIVFANTHKIVFNK